MKLGLLLIALLLCRASVIAQLNYWKPTEREPLTSLPWKDAQLSMDQILEQVFREPNPDIRYPVLSAYLESIPSSELGKAFNIAVVLEGISHPDDLVSLMLRIWARRDPAMAWEKTKALFKLVGFEDGWLQYDGWKTRDPIKVDDLTAIRASSFWLERRSTLASFPEGVNGSEVPDPERVRLYKRFLELWFEKTSDWPVTIHGIQGADSAYLDSSYWGGARVVEAFELPEAQLAEYRPKASLEHFDSSSDRQRIEEAAFEVVCRRRLKTHPELAGKIIDSIEYETVPKSMPPSTGPFILLPDGFLQLWASVDPSGLQAWAETPPDFMREAVWTAKCILWHRVDAATREHWFDKEIKRADSPIEAIRELAKWEPEATFEKSIQLKSPEALSNAANAAVYGHRLWNFCHAGLRAIESFDFAHVPADVADSLKKAWLPNTFMEQWGDIDPSSCARFGLKYLLMNNYPKRSELLRFFSGEDDWADEGGVLDRTFCALRVWAVFRPDEMREWIKTQQGDDLRQALTWLLEHPWGSAPEKQ